jgi:membrane associated rhomboid family serine protease
MIPLSDASRQPATFPAATTGIIVVNGIVFVMELMGGDAFVMKWSEIPANIVAGHHWITILTAMFMHGGWMHIIGNMVFLWAFGPEVEDSMGPVKYLVFYCSTGARRRSEWAHAPTLCARRSQKSSKRPLSL